MISTLFLFSLSTLLAAFPVLAPDRAAARPDDSGTIHAGALLAAGDTLGALSALDSLLKATGEKGPLYLLRGEIRLAAGERDRALDDFRRAAKSGDRQVRLAAWLGTSRTHRIFFRDNLRAMQACRKGLSIDGNDPGLLLERAMIQFALGGDYEYSLAGEYLTRVIEIDPTFGNAYRIWRDSLLFHPSHDTGRVTSAITKWLESNPDSAGWWVEIAWDEFLAGKTENALALLERLEAVRPGFDSADRRLLLARCRLEKGDSLGFQELYMRALDIAVERDEPTRAFAETEVILTDLSIGRWSGLETSIEKAAFLRRHWRELNDDPLEPLNRGLIEHYTRLRYAGLNYSLNRPHAFFQNSENYHRLLSPQSGTYHFDSELIRKQNAILRLDPRGIVLVRLGEPDKIEKHFNEDLPRDITFGSYFANDASVMGHRANRRMDFEYWYYDKYSLLFADLAGAGNYVFIPRQDDSHLVDMMKVLDNVFWDDPTVNYTLEYYVAQFLAGNSSGSEVEFYQEDRLPKGMRPTATMALYDSLWGEIERREGEVFRIGTGRDTDHWLARHRITVIPGNYNYTIRMASDEEKWLGKGRLEFLPFDPDSLQISAVVLGTAPARNMDSPERMGVRFVPRPATGFGRGEQVTVYAEFYGLRPDHNGRRHYKQWIDIVRLEEGESRIRKYAGKVLQLLTFNTGDALASVSLSFEREADWRGDRAPETFTFDTSELRNGSYRMVFQVRDNVSGLWDIEEVFFDIENEPRALLEP